MPDPPDAEHRSWFDRVQQRQVDRAAQRMHARLVEAPTSFRSAPSTAGVLSLSIGVLLAAVAGVLALVLLATRADQWWEWVVVGLGASIAILARPRPPRLPDDAIALPVEEFPAVHRLVANLADAVDVRPPRTIAVDAAFNAAVMPLGWRGRPALILGLPLWTMQTWNQRFAVLGHELGHLRGADTTRARIQLSAGQILHGVWHLVAPAEREPGHEGLEAIEWLGWVVQRFLGLPLQALILVSARLGANHRQHREYLADRRAAQVAGSEAMISALVMDLPGLSTAVRSAHLRGEDVFEFLAARSSATPAGAPARPASPDKPHRADATHPPDHLRISLLERHPAQPVPGVVDEATRAAAEAELTSLRRPLDRQFRDELRTTWH